MAINKILYIEHKDFVEGILKDGKSFYIDYKDYELVKNNYWHYVDGYLTSSRLGLMHRVILSDILSSSDCVDHIDRNRLNNRRSNLRLSCRQQNAHNKSVYKTNTSGYPGVKWNPKLQKWQVQITRNKKRTHLGVYDELQEAIRARKVAEAAK